MDEKADDDDLACQAKRGGCSHFALRSVTQTVQECAHRVPQSGTTTNSNRRDRPADDKKVLLVPIACEIGLELREIFLRRNFVTGQDANDLNRSATTVRPHLQ